MCGIIGITAPHNISHHILSCLENLEYRGYDSAGIATIHHQEWTLRKTVGKLQNLKNLIRSQPLTGSTAIGHTRWATHGAINQDNAHPHIAPSVALVHNGIIENYDSLATRYQLPSSIENDTAVLTLLLDLWHRQQGLSPEDTLIRAMQELEGSYAFVALFLSEPSTLYAARQGSPLVIGKGLENHHHYVGSDALCMASTTQDIAYIQDQQWAKILPESFTIFDAKGHTLNLPLVTHHIPAHQVSKGHYKHFMEKEIAEQPLVLHKTLAPFLSSDTIAHPHIKTLTSIPWDTIPKILITGCGSAYYAALTAQYWFENLAHIPCQVELSSEYRYRTSPASPHDIVIAISQSGETKDTLEALKKAQLNNLRTLALVNVASSSLTRIADHTLLTEAGPEIAVASTKAFTSQLAALLVIAIIAGKKRQRLSSQVISSLSQALSSLPAISDTIINHTDYSSIAQTLHSMQTILYIGRNFCYPIALEAALKMKEISYIHAEGYASGELKHGPIALVDCHTSVIAIAPPSHLSDTNLFVKTMSNLHSSTARGCTGIIISDKKGVRTAQEQNPHLLSLTMPSHIHTALIPILYTLPIQLLAYHTALLKGTDIDQPRNLAKSVTVE